MEGEWNATTRPGRKRSRRKERDFVVKDQIAELDFSSGGEATTEGR